MASKTKTSKIPKAIKNAYPKSPSDYKALGGKTRRYRIEATGEEISRRQYLTAIRGRSNESYAAIPDEFKQQKPRGGRGKPSSKKLIDSKGRLYGTTFTWQINYQSDLWARFINQSLIEANKVFPNTLCRFYVEIKGNGIFTTKSGKVSKKGRLAMISSPIFEVVDIQMDGTLFALSLYIGPIDFPIVKKIRLAIYPVKDN